MLLIAGKIPKKYLAEVIGTFTLIFFITGAIVVNEVTSGALTNGGVSILSSIIVFVIVITIGDISGAHINPAVTIGFVAARRMQRTEAMYYILAQAIGAILASLVLKGVFPHHPTLGGTYPQGSELQSFVVEVVITFLLMFSILNAVDTNKEKGVQVALAISVLVGIEGYIAGPISGCSLNPIRSLAPALVTGNLHAQWIYILAPLAGVYIAVIVFDFLKKF